MSDDGVKTGMTPSHPGAFIRIEVIEEFGLSVAAAARMLGVRRATFSNLLNGNASLSPEMALRVEKAFGLSMDLLLRMQAWAEVGQGPLPAPGRRLRTPPSTPVPATPTGRHPPRGADGPHVLLL